MNETVRVPVYDRSRFLLAIPAGARPNPIAKVEAFLKTPDGMFPVVFRKPERGIIDIMAHSKEDALAISRQLGFEPEFRGRAELRRIKDKSQAQGATSETPLSITAQAPKPGIGTTFDVYGGIYFAQVSASQTGPVIIPRYGNAGPCTNLPMASYVGYDAKSLALGTITKGGTIGADLVVEVYK